MFSFISFHAKKYRVTSVCGGEEAILDVHQDAQERLSHSAQPLGSYSRQLNQARVQMAGPRPSELQWELGTERTLTHSPSTPMSLSSCPVLRLSRGYLGDLQAGSPKPLGGSQVVLACSG
ncbi:rCG32530 [Rattus norvegicus]|uniref:RCG32530 n=1 Tax=Rattus norvegicus TaxID=10116 RepID=A6HGW2_RAT|nr:rCG32530 [Rattus norvegicus]